MAGGKERRRNERLDSKLFAEIETPKKESLGRAVVIDVSISGFAIETEADLSPNQMIDCHIEVPITLRASVVRAITEGQLKLYGCRFVGQGFLDKIILKKILKGRRKTTKV